MTIVSKIFLVNKNGIKAFQQLGCTNVMWLPNCIDINKFKKTIISKNYIWAMATRIDIDKLPEIKAFLTLADKTNIERIDIYGNGQSMDEIKTWIQTQKFRFYVCFMGHTDNLYETITGKYNGIAASGRTALECLVMGYPVLSVGLGKVRGLINKKVYEELKESNFILNNVEFNVSDDDLIKGINTLNSNLNEYDCSAIANKDFDSKLIGQKLITEIKASAINYEFQLTSFYDELKNLPNQKEQFNESRAVYELLSNFLEAGALNIQVKNLFLLSRELFRNYNSLTSLKSDEERLKILESKLDETINKELATENQFYQSLENINFRFDTFGTKSLLKNDFQKMKSSVTKNKNVN